MSVPELKADYQKRIVPALMKSRQYKNRHEVPALEKIVVNSGMSTALDKNAIQQTVGEVTLLTGQKPIVTKARESISNFKLREGMPVGVKVTLRGSRMYEFFYRFISIALPGIRDFRGISKKLDGQGNYTIGIKDHTIFPEINIDPGKRTIGMDISIVTTAKADDEAFELPKLFGMPFRA